MPACWRCILHLLHVVHLLMPPRCIASTLLRLLCLLLLQRQRIDSAIELPLQLLNHDELVFVLATPAVGCCLLSGVLAGHFRSGSREG